MRSDFELDIRRDAEPEAKLVDFCCVQILSVSRSLSKKNEQSGGVVKKYSSRCHTPLHDSQLYESLSQPGEFVIIRRTVSHPKFNMPQFVKDLDTAA